MAKQPKKIGRPSAYKPGEHPAAARLLTGNGKTIADLAETFGVARSTVEEWQKNHPEFSASIDLGREDANRKVEQCLFQRATGYTFDSEKIVVVAQGEHMGSAVERVPIKEHCPPDVAAQKHWLNNRDPKNWKERTTTEHEVGSGLAKLLEEADKRVKS